MRDLGFLLDMLIAARHVSGYVQGMAWSRFVDDPTCQDAVAYRIQVIGEAASQVSNEYRQEHPEIPWAKITGMRHRIVHNYRDLRRDRLWSTAQNDIPELIKLLEPLVPPEEPG